MKSTSIKCGTFYTPGGFGSVIDGFVKLCKELSVKFVTNTNVEKINVENNLAKSISTNNGTYEFDKIVASQIIIMLNNLYSLKIKEIILINTGKKKYFLHLLYFFILESIKNL